LASFAVYAVGFTARDAKSDAKGAKEFGLDCVKTAPYMTSRWSCR
jgi:hypothetical protein